MEVSGDVVGLEMACSYQNLSAMSPYLLLGSLAGSKNPPKCLNHHFMSIGKV